MDKRLILAVAGSGKTTYIIDRIDRAGKGQEYSGSIGGNQ